MREISYREAVREALAEEMRRDERVFLLGEDIADPFGGSYKVTLGLTDEFGPERVRNTPLSEAAIAGAALGAALTGMRPVAEIMYVDFITLAMDQIVNQAAKIRYMSGGQTAVPLVIRTQGGPGRSSAAQHAQSLEAWFIHVPGLFVVMPSTPYDAKGLLKSAIRDDNPVIFIEHKLLYNEKGPVPAEPYAIPLGQADVKREGEHVTIVATSMALWRALEAAEELAAVGISAEIVDPRTLFPLDVDTIVESVKRTGRLVVVHEAVGRGGFGAEVAAQVGTLVFDYLDAPIQRVAAPPVPVPFAPVLEKQVMIHAADIVAAVQNLFA
ncbi:MAG: alpha-ketoacid dehydrogenase subunit beta [Anaerolineae bacterium]